MKEKFIVVFGLILCLFLFPLAVYADMGAPDITSYDVIITNKEGVQIKNYSGKTATIPYDTKVTVTYEYSTKGKLYGTVEYDGVMGDIDLDDAKVLEDKIDFGKFSKAEKPISLYVFGDGVYLYKGPSTAYGKVDGEKKIPVGETVTYEYYDEIWAYVEYDGVKGWIFKYPYFDLYDNLKVGVANISSDNNKVLILENIKELLVNPRGEEKVSVDIPAGEEIEYKYYLVGPKSKTVYIEYKDYKGWLFTSFDYLSKALISSECYSMIVLSDNFTIYGKMGDLKSKKKTNVPVGTEANVLYYYYKDDYVWMQLSYGGNKVWIATKEDDSTYKSAESYGTIRTYKSKEELEVYEMPSKDAKKLSKKIEVGTEVDVYYSFYDSSYSFKDDYYEWSYIRNGKVEGWVLTSKLDKSSETTKSYCMKEENETSNDKDKKEDKDTDEESESLPVMVIVAIAIGGAVVLALVVIVTIVLVNKKKKNKVQ